MMMMMMKSMMKETTIVDWKHIHPKFEAYDRLIVQTNWVTLHQAFSEGHLVTALQGINLNIAVKLTGETAL